MRHKKLSEAKRFDNLLIKPSRNKRNSCWLYPFINPVTGYGVHTIFYDGKPHSISAHRHAFELKNGPIPAGKHVLHACIGTRGCCNPSHLRLGTPQDNADDCVKQGRSSHYEDRKPKVPLSESEKQTILVDYEQGRTIYSISTKLHRDFKTIRSWLSTRQKRADREREQIATMLRPNPLPNTLTSRELPLAA